MVEAGMETSRSIDPRPSFTPLTTAGHPPTPECSAPPCTGVACDLVTVPARQGLEAVDILRRGAVDAVGPVLHDGGCDTLGFVVPAGTAAAWDVPGSTCTETDGRGLRLLPEPRGEGGEGSDWLLPPGEADLATDPAVLRRALGEAARLIEAADNCQ
ncbi:hypothetical protein [Streptomyces sp. CC219B]|uniref:hypothetical protein n=1 Tax=Streptomyces sp. CC219B TaxID=3044574 RepID=UPI0024A9AC33|nr:hypothetical protein [Streptomyces sp. CC219B]